MIREMLVAALVVAMATIAWAQEPTTDLTELSLEELMNIEVTSVAKKPQKLSDAPAAVYVITGEEIRRAGATTIPAALRLVPGVHAARIDANKWAVAARGFNGRFMQKVLVLVDGRCVYTSMHGGVYWEQQDVLLDDVDRIEVVRGPGGTLWGANAMNAVINIVTKHAKETQGGLLTAALGTEEQALGHLRYGGQLSEHAWYRVYAKYLERDEAVDADGTDTADAWTVRRTGFRIDWDVSPSDSLTFQGDYYDEDAGQRLTYATPASPGYAIIDEALNLTGGDVLFHWKHRYHDTSELALQAYYDRTERDGTSLPANRHTADIDFQYRLPLGERHDLLWGLGYRWTADKVENSFNSALNPAERTDHLVSAFIQDEITLTPDRLLLTLGSKFEHNDYTGFEIQPSARLLWKPSPRRTVWTAVSRAVRTPARVDEDISATLPAVMPGVFPRILGNPDYKSQELLAFELGYRVEPTDRLSLDAAAFYNTYDHLRATEPGLPFPETSPAPAHLVVPAVMDNRMEAETYGAELALDWEVSNRCRLRSGYTLLNMQLHLKEDSRNLTMEQTEGENPENQLFIHASMNLPRNLELDLVVVYADSLPALEVDSVIEADARLGWSPNERLEIFIVGQNLIHNHHAEYAPKYMYTQATETQRGVYAGITWHF